MRRSVVAAAIGISVRAICAEAGAAIRQLTNIPPQDLDAALQELARDRNVQIVYRSELVGEHQTGGANGYFTFDEALTQLLKGTGLTYRYLAERAITIVPMGEVNDAPALPGGSR
jgi:hypothetical protein